MWDLKRRAHDVESGSLGSRAGVATEVREALASGVKLGSKTNKSSKPGKSYFFSY